MEIGCHLPTTQAPEATRKGLLTFAREAEQRHIASLWVSDHVVIPRVTTGYAQGGSFPHPPDKAYLEPVAVLAAAGRPFETIKTSLRFAVVGELLSRGHQAVVDRLREYNQLGVSPLLLMFRRDDLARMLEILDLVARTIRPAVDAA